MKNNQEWDYKEIRTSEHDELIMYLLDEKNIKKWMNKKYETKINKLETEVPVKAGYKKDFIVGYIDILVEYNLYNKEHKYEITTKKSKFLDEEQKCSLCNREKDEVDKCFARTGVFYIEVKPEVGNFGSLIRQIKKYKEYMPKGDWIVYTKKCSEKIYKALKSQGVLVFLHKAE